VRASHHDVRSGVTTSRRPSTQAGDALEQPHSSAAGHVVEIDLSQFGRYGGWRWTRSGRPKTTRAATRSSLSGDRSRWTEVARAAANDRALDIEFSPYPARYIRIEQTGWDLIYWWSIHGVSVKSAPYTPVITASASHNNVLSGADNIAQALDGTQHALEYLCCAATGHWFELDLNQVRSVSGLALDTSASPTTIRAVTQSAYPPTTANGQKWPATTATIGPWLSALGTPGALHPYCADRLGRPLWWSIHGVSVKG